MITYTVRKSIKLYAIYVNFGNILFLEFEIIVFLFKVIWNIKLDVHNSVCRAAWLMTHLRLKLTWIDCRFNPVWKPCLFERALNAMRYMWIWQHSYTQHRRKLCFYIENCLIQKKQLMNMICSCRGTIRSFVWIEDPNKRKHPSSPS